MAVNTAILATSFSQKDRKLLDEAISGGGGGGAFDPNAVHEGDAAGGDLTGTYPNPGVVSSKLFPLLHPSLANTGIYAVGDGFDIKVLGTLVLSIKQSGLVTY